MIQKSLVEIEIVGIGKSVMIGIVHLEISLLFNDLQFVPLNICIRN